MAKKYNYTITRSIEVYTTSPVHPTKQTEAVTVEGCDSLDEAVNAVKKAIYELDLGRETGSPPKISVGPLPDIRKESAKISDPNTAQFISGGTSGASKDINPEDIPL